jgi:GNAT superfamily N-acetyltransferase
MILPKNISISPDKDLLDLPMIQDFLREAYWAKDRSPETIQTTIEHSFCFGLYHNKQQIGFARVVSDCRIFAYIMDVFVLDEYRGQGLGKLLMQYVLDESQLKEVKKWMLGTRDAHGLYRQLGFTDIPAPELWMQYIRS